MDVVIEKSQTNYSAFSRDVWGCIAAGETLKETVFNMREAMQLHLDVMINDGDDIPKAKGISQHIEDGVFKREEIADEYYITQVETAIPQHA